MLYCGVDISRPLVALSWSKYIVAKRWAQYDKALDNCVAIDGSRDSANYFFQEK